MDVLGEFLGTMILTTLGCGVVAGVLLNKTKAQNAGWMVVTAGWAFAVMAGVISGKMELPKALVFAAAEVAGAFAGAVIVWLHYLPHWRETPDPAVKLAVFCTAPAIRDYPANLLSEAIATFVLVFVGTAVVEKGIGGALAAPLAGALVWGIGLSLGATTGYAINPARDLGPRLVAWIEAPDRGEGRNRLGLLVGSGLRPAHRRRGRGAVGERGDPVLTWNPRSLRARPVVCSKACLASLPAVSPTMKPKLSRRQLLQLGGISVLRSCSARRPARASRTVARRSRASLSCSTAGAATSTAST